MIYIGAGTPKVAVSETQDSVSETQDSVSATQDSVSALCCDMQLYQL